MTTATDRNWPGSENDPKGAKFYMHPDKPPTSEWAYIVDDSCVGYRRDTVWPFRSTRTDDGSDEYAERQFARKGHTLGEGCGWRSVRLAPDTEYCAAGQNYVTVWPDAREAWKANADLHLYVRPQGHGAIVLDCSVTIDLRDMAATVTTWPIDGSPIAADGFSEDFPEALKAQAQEKATKIVALLAEHIARRNAGKHKIETAHEKWAKGQASA
jgi:hypothetical protein